MEAELVSSDTGPAKKVYTVTDDGRAQLRRVALGMPEPPVLRNSFWLQLIKTAAVLDPKKVAGSFAEFLVETNCGKSFRTYDDETAAEAWLVGRAA